MKKWVLDRLKERSTWRGIALLLAAAGVAVDPNLLELAGVAVVALIGSSEVVKREL